MANPDYSEDFNKRKQASSAKRKTFHGSDIGFNESTANWGGLPGKTQPKDRSGGTPKVKIYPQSKGL